MIFVLDIGNTNVVAGVYEREGAAPGRGRLRQAWRFASDRLKTTDEYLSLLRDFFRQAGLNPARVRGGILSSVVPPLTLVFEEACRRLFGRPALVVGPGLDLGLKGLTDNPSEVGADRLVNAVAGFALHGGPLVVMDFGTATTFDAVSRKGEYLGGAIAPGVSISTEALVSRTARLPRIDMARPLSPIGRNTVESMRSGIYYGTLGQAREILSRLRRELGPGCRAVATGGLSGWLPVKELGLDSVDPDLTLEGLRLLFQRNQGRPARRR